MDQDNSQRPMVQGSWTCAECGKEITELPFEPSGDRPVHCKDCWRTKRNQGGGGNFGGGDRAPRQMHQGNWKCAECGTEITELPFEPSGDRPVHCRDCWRKKREERY